LELPARGLERFWRYFVAGRAVASVLVKLADMLGNAAAFDVGAA
jgi:hypothetical protein